MFKNKRASDRARRASLAKRGRGRDYMNGLTGQPYPGTGDTVYTVVEVAFLKAIETHQKETGRRFPTHSEYLALATRVLAEHHGLSAA